jgi:integrase
VVEATLPFLGPTVADMVRVQLLTGMRSGELVLMRTIDLDTAGSIWLYRPGSDQDRHGRHKTSHLGHERVIAIGPHGQQILRHHLKAELCAYLFAPQEVVLQLRAEQRKKRKTKVQPSQQDRRKRNPTVRPGVRYTVGSYRTAIQRACAKAKVEPWFPHQLRHSRATEIRRLDGLDAARAVLGHRSPIVTEVYAELDVGKAAEVMGRIG